MIPIYKAQTVEDLPAEMKDFALRLEALINEKKRAGLTPSDALNILANAYANMGRGAEVPPELLKDLVSTCVDNTLKYPPETFFRKAGGKAGG